MLSHLNTLIGFAAMFALLSLVVTAVTQVIRTLLGMKPKALVETLLRLFGEIEGRDRLVAAILSHPTLAGQAGRKDYEKLVDPAKENNDPEVAAATTAVLDAYQHLRDRRGLGRRLKTVDLDKQTTKDLASVGYKGLRERADPGSPADGLENRSSIWAAPFQKSLKATSDRGLEPTGGAQAEPVAMPHFGRIWRLATAAFPEAKGKANPMKTYVAAFHDEAAASAADSFTLKIRLVTLFVALAVAGAFQVNAIDVWNRMAKADPKQIAEFASSVEKLNDSVAEGPKPGKAAEPQGANVRTQQVVPPQAGAAPPAEPPKDIQQTSAPDVGKDVRAQVAKLDQLVKQVQESPVPLALSPPADWTGYVKLALSPGFWLAVIALSIGAPFWFETLQSAINMKSAFTKEKKKA